MFLSVIGSVNIVLQNIVSICSFIFIYNFQFIFFQVYTCEVTAADSKKQLK